jgi:hypothetical protein
MPLNDEETERVRILASKINTLRTTLGFWQFEQAVLPDLKQIQEIGVEALEQLSSQCGLVLPVGYFRKSSGDN